MNYFIGRMLLPLAAVLLLSAGCQSISTSHTREIGGPRFAPSDPDRVEILSERPIRPFVRIGEVQLDLPDPKVDTAKIENALRKEAAKLGGDAAVVVYDKTNASKQYIGGWRTREAEPVSTRAILAVVIKYQ